MSHKHTMSHMDKHKHKLVKDNLHNTYAKLCDVYTALVFITYGVDMMSIQTLF